MKNMDRLLSINNTISNKIDPKYQIFLYLLSLPTLDQKTAIKIDATNNNLYKLNG